MNVEVYNGFIIDETEKAFLVLSEKDNKTVIIEKKSYNDDITNKVIVHKDVDGQNVVLHIYEKKLTNDKLVQILRRYAKDIERKRKTKE